MSCSVSQPLLPELGRERALIIIFATCTVNTEEPNTCWTRGGWVTRSFISNAVRAPMISEVVNSLFVTYFASEFLVSETSSIDKRRHNSWSGSTKRFIKERIVSLSVGIFIVLLVNLLDHVSGIKDKANGLVQGFFHLPRIIFAAVTYMICLYYDIHRRAPLLTLPAFLAKVGWAFLRVLPAYPFLAVLISFVFLFVINIWEALGLPLEWLNAPIYYGTLYGPFAWVYTQVKRQVLGEYSSLPTWQISQPPRRIKSSSIHPYKGLWSSSSFATSTSRLVVRMRKYDWMMEWCIKISGRAPTNRFHRTSDEQLSEQSPGWPTTGYTTGVVN